MLYLFGTGVTSRQMASYPCCVFDEWEMKDHPTHTHARCLELGSKTSMGLLRIGEGSGGGDESSQS